MPSAQTCFIREENPGGGGDRDSIKFSDVIMLQGTQNPVPLCAGIPSTKPREIAIGPALEYSLPWEVHYFTRQSLR